METNLSTRDLRAFLALSQTCNFGQAALQLHLTQSALSALIARLEAQVGTRLFERTTRSVTLTAAGRAFSEHVVDILQQTQNAVQTVRDITTLQHGKVSVAALPSLTASLLPEVFAAFRARHPKVGLAITEALASDAFEQVRQGKVDFALTAAHPRQEDLAYEAITQDHFLLLCAPDHPLAGESSPIALQDSLQWPHVSMPVAASVRQYIDRALDQQGIRFSPAFEVHHIATIGALVAQGLGVTALPETAIELIAHRQLHTRPLAAPGIQRPLWLVHRKYPGLSHAAETMRQMILAHYASPASSRNIARSASEIATPRSSDSRR